MEDRHRGITEYVCRRKLGEIELACYQTLIDGRQSVANTNMPNRPNRSNRSNRSNWPTLPFPVAIAGVTCRKPIIQSGLTFTSTIRSTKALSQSWPRHLMPMPMRCLMRTAEDFVHGLRNKGCTPHCLLAYSALRLCLALLCFAYPTQKTLVHLEPARFLLLSFPLPFSS